MKDGSTVSNRSNLLRYLLWLFVAQTAYANRQHYRMFTTWLPHLLTNTLSLLLPDVVRLLFPEHKPEQSSQNLVEDVLVMGVRDNSWYAYYVAPLALGYIVSHPKFNIYKGEWGEKRFAGLGLDAIPHAATAFALSALTVDTLNKKTNWREYDNLVGDVLQRMRHHPELASLGVLMAATVMWEYNEYRVNRYEMSLRGSVDAINMIWDTDDAKRDTVANLLGWLLAVIWNAYKRKNLSRSAG
jgi:hypothetical protein